MKKKKTAMTERNFYQMTILANSKATYWSLCVGSYPYLHPEDGVVMFARKAHAEEVAAAGPEASVEELSLDAIPKSYEVITLLDADERRWRLLDRKYWIQV
jgi:hypothetical protein